MMMRDKLLVTIYRFGSKDLLGQADEDDLMRALNVGQEELHRLAGQLDQLGYLDWHQVSVGSLKLTGSGILRAEQLLR